MYFLSEPLAGLFSHGAHHLLHIPIVRDPHAIESLDIRRSSFAL